MARVTQTRGRAKGRGRGNPSRGVRRKPNVVRHGRIRVSQLKRFGEEVGAVDPIYDPGRVDPIIVATKGGRIKEIVDGYHRAAGFVAGKLKYVPAILVSNDDNAPESDLVAAAAEPSGYGGVSQSEAIDRLYEMAEQTKRRHGNPSRDFKTYGPGPTIKDRRQYLRKEVAWPPYQVEGEQFKTLGKAEAAGRSRAVFGKRAVEVRDSLGTVLSVYGPRGDEIVPDKWMENPVGKGNPRRSKKQVRVVGSDHVTVNVNPRRKKPSDKLRDMERPEVLGYELDRETLTPKRGYIDTSRPGDYGADPIGDGMFRMVPSGDIVDYEERNRRLKKNPNVGREPNGPHIVGTTAYQVGVQEGERGTRKSKPTNVQIKDAIEAAYPQYKRTLQPSYVRKLASVYTRQWKAGVKDGKAARKGNKGRRGQVNPNWSPTASASTDADVAEVKRQLKLSKVPASVRVERNIKRSYGTLTVRPRGKPYWTMDQVVNVAGILNRMGYNVEEHSEGGLSAYRSGFHYMRKVRRNPNGNEGMTDADYLYEKFHGKGPTQTTEVRTVISSRDNLTELGNLAELDVHLMTDEKVKLKFPLSGRGAIMLCSSPDGRQLYFEGGNQYVDLAQLGMGGRDWVRDQMTLGVLLIVTYRTEKGFDKFELTDYFHHLGEVTGQRPVLNYDNINHLLSVSGGQYEVRPEGIVN